MAQGSINDVLYCGADMMCNNFMPNPEPYESEYATVTDVDDADLFPMHYSDVNHDISYSVVDCFLYGSEMKHLSSQDSITSSPFVAFPPQSPAQLAEGSMAGR